MLVHKLNFDDFDESEFQLIAIHTVLEDYKLAYHINQILPINLASNQNKISINVNRNEVKFDRFSFFDNETEILWDLFQNTNSIVQQSGNISQNLFSDLNLEISTKVFLLPEFKKVDFFLKIENAAKLIQVKDVLILLNTIDNISAAFTINLNKVRSKNNLIF